MAHGAAGGAATGGITGTGANGAAANAGAVSTAGGSGARGFIVVVAVIPDVAAGSCIIQTALGNAGGGVAAPAGFCIEASGADGAVCGDGAGTADADADGTAASDDTADIAALTLPAL